MEHPGGLTSATDCRHCNSVNIAHTFDTLKQRNIAELRHCGAVIVVSVTVKCADFILLSTTNKMQRYTILFIIVSALHVSGGYSAHHQELKNCTHSI